MGYGDEVLASGLAKGAHARGKLIAFGNGKKIIWSPKAQEVFYGNPNVARPGSERNGELEWIEFYAGHRIYMRSDGDRYLWNYDFRATPGELFFDREEMGQAKRVGSKFVLIEPNVMHSKSWTVNKIWPVDRYQGVVDALKKNGRDVIQLIYPGARHRLSGVRAISTRSAREAFAVLSCAALYIGPEGGMHHAAAALGVPAVVLFGGFIPPSVMGYDGHINLTGGAEACGWKRPCGHCKAAMNAITVDEVVDAARKAER